MLWHYPGLSCGAIRVRARDPKAPRKLSSSTYPQLANYIDKDSEKKKGDLFNVDMLGKSERSSNQSFPHSVLRTVI